MPRRILAVVALLLAPPVVGASSDAAPPGAVLADPAAPEPAPGPPWAALGLGALLLAGAWLALRRAPARAP